MRSRRAVPADRRRRRARKSGGRAARALGRRERRRDRANGERSRRGRVGYHLDFPGNPLRPAATTSAGRNGSSPATRADRVCARRGGPRRAGPALAPVLVLLRVQRLQQQARRRLGDDPARLRRRRRRGGARPGADAGRLQPARERGAGRVGRSQARARRLAARRLPGGRLPRELLRVCAVPRRQRRGGRRLRRRHRPVRAPSSPASSRAVGARGRRWPRLPLARVPRALGRAAAARLLRRSDGPEREAPVGRADRLGRRDLARTELRGGRRLGCSGPVRRASSATRSRAARIWSARRRFVRGPSPSRLLAGLAAARLARDADGLAPGCAAPARAPAGGRADALGGGAPLRRAPGALRRHRTRLRPVRVGRLAARAGRPAADGTRVAGRLDR